MSVPAEKVVRSGGDIPPYLAQAFREAAERAIKLSREEYRPYEGERLGQYNPMLHQAEQMAGSIQGGYDPYFNRALGHVRRGSESFLENYRPYLNPRQESLLRGIEEEGQRALKEKVLPGLEARYISLGQHGSSRHAKMARRAAKDVQTEIGNRQEEALSKDYNQALRSFSEDRARELEAANLLAKLGTSRQSANIAKIRALQEAGLLRHERDQLERDWEYELWKEARRHPSESLAHYFSILQGVPIVPSMYRRSEVRQLRPSWHGRDWQNLGAGMLENFMFSPRR